MPLKKNLALSETGFIFNPSTGDSFSANPVASEMIALLREGKSPEEIKKQLLNTYEVEKISLDKDFDDLMMQLRDNNLLDS
ncbi:MAG: hypothetical protein RLZZ46_744 [Bacteroidota bacterium]|jgi:hypothetical protein